MSDNLASKITDSELEVMKLPWCAKDALAVTAIREHLQESKGWEPATIKTLISRLVAKGAVRQEKRNVFYYSPVITEKEYSSWATIPEELGQESQASSCVEEWNSTCLSSCSWGDSPLVKLCVYPTVFSG